jgi:hypothetical protein
VSYRSQAFIAGHSLKRVSGHVAALVWPPTPTYKGNARDGEADGSNNDPERSHHLAGRGSGKHAFERCAIGGQAVGGQHELDR